MLVVGCGLLPGAPVAENRCYEYRQFRYEIGKPSFLHALSPPAIDATFV
jgi:hypothetical protein